MTTPGYPRTFGSYVLLDRLGEGGMSEVDLARRAVDDANFVRFVVIKRIHAQHQDDDGFVRMFHDEARINAELQHENIASVYDFGQEGNEFFLAMEYVPGCDLRRVQRRLAKARRPFPLPIVLRTCCDVLAALDYAHHRVDTYGRSMNIVHRDVNPRNIMLSVRGEVKLIDFGVAKADNRAEHTVGHSLKGKFAYMAPEQIEGGRDIDGRADIFALGIVLYELLMGCSPVAGLNEVQTMHRILSGQLPPVRSTPERPIPDDLIAVHARACATRPEDRFATAGEMRQALLDLAPQCGGVASNQELSDFLSEIDPDFGQVSSRLRVLRDESTEELSRSRGGPPPASEPVSSPGTLA
ncbi:MAG: serine/threonine protein kinase, partial [Deltaproteobacteria bacterium]